MSEKTCQYLGCDCDEFVEVLTPEQSKHYGKRLCVSNHHFNGWLPKPDKDRAKRPSSHKRLVKKHGKGFCELCLISDDNLEGHHVIPYKNDGDSTRGNVWIVCKSCHSLIHWKRTYHGTNERISHWTSNMPIRQKCRHFAVQVHIT